MAEAVTQAILESRIVKASWEASGISQQEFAVQLGLNLRTLRSYMSGTRRVPKAILEKVDQHPEARDTSGVTQVASDTGLVTQVTQDLPSDFALRPLKERMELLAARVVSRLSGAERVTDEGVTRERYKPRRDNDIRKGMWVVWDRTGHDGKPLRLSESGYLVNPDHGPPHDILEDGYPRGFPGDTPLMRVQYRTPAAIMRSGGREALIAAGYPVGGESKSHEKAAGEVQG